MIVCRGVRLWSGYAASEDGALREVRNLCGLTLGDHGCVEEDLGGTAMSAEAEQPVRNRHGLKLVSGHRSGR